MRFSLLLLGLLGCGPRTVALPVDLGADQDGGALPDPGGVFAGSRLRPLLWVPADGSAARETLETRSMARADEDFVPQPGGSVFRDSAFAGRRCAVRRSFRGDRCVPEAPWLNTYLDPACLELAGLVTPCADELASSWGFGRRDGERSVDALFSRVARDRCEGPGPPDPLGAEGPATVFTYTRVPDEDFVALVDERRGPAGADALDVVRRYEDGTVERLVLPAVPCRVRRTTAGTRCVAPTELVIGTQLGFADPDGAIPALAADVERVGETFAATGLDPADDTLRLYGYTARANRPVYRRDDAGRCRTNALAQVFQLGEELDPANFPALTATPLGTGRLRPLRWLDEDGRPWSVEGPEEVRQIRETPGGAFALTRTREVRFLDTELDVTCVPSETRAGLRCLPGLGGLAGLFADDACTEPAMARFLGGPSPGPVPAFSVAVEGPAFLCGAPHDVTVRPVEGPVTAGVGIFRRTDEDCEPAFPRDAELYEAYLLGDPVPLETFAGFTTAP